MCRVIRPDSDGGDGFDGLGFWGGVVLGGGGGIDGRVSKCDGEHVGISFTKSTCV